MTLRLRNFSISYAIQQHSCIAVMTCSSSYEPVPVVQDLADYELDLMCPQPEPSTGPSTSASSLSLHKPVSYLSITALALCCFLAGAILGVVLLHRCQSCQSAIAALETALLPELWKRPPPFDSSFNRSQVSAAADAEPPMTEVSPALPQRLEWNVSLFRAASFPILWSAAGHISWNDAAESAFSAHLSRLQAPANSGECFPAGLVLVEEWFAGIFSRLSVLVDSLIDALHFRRPIALLRRRMEDNGAGWADPQAEGLQLFLDLDHFQPHCGRPSVLDALRDFMKREGPAWPSVASFNALRTHSYRLARVAPNGTQGWTENELQALEAAERYLVLFAAARNPIDPCALHMRRDWFGFVPATGGAATEHIYVYSDASGRDWQQMCFAFRRFLQLQFSRLLWKPRASITALSDLLWDFHVRSVAAELGLETPFDVAAAGSDPVYRLAALHMRRGDKWKEDDFFKTHGHFRNLSLFMKPLLEYEQRVLVPAPPASHIVQQRRDAGVLSVNMTRFPTLFLLTDDAKLRPELESYCRAAGRRALDNVYAAVGCQDEYSRVAMETFLSSFQLILQHADVVVTHEQSNIGRWLASLRHAMARDDSSVLNAPDSL